ncbi:MAG: methyltransferase domain-containing protein [bacterium]|jgi:ubiquinone/menaquinone biosynthesis C-methylase UbiE
MRDRIGRFVIAWRTRVVLPHIRGRLLDVGCGLNELVKAYTGEGTGVDVYQWGDVDLVVEDAGDLPFEDGEFDTVTVVAALNHIPNRADALAEAYRVLRSGGRIIVTMIPAPVGRVWHFARKPWDADQMERGMGPGELHGLSRGEVHRLLKGAGFRISSEERFMLGLNLMTIATKPQERPE